MSDLQDYEYEDANESLPLIKREGSTLHNLHDLLQETASIIPESCNSSPTKPLKLIKTTPDINSEQLEKFINRDFNSSSDTIIDEDTEKSNESASSSNSNSISNLIKLHGPKDLPIPDLTHDDNRKEPSQQKSSLKLSSDLFEKNFDLSESEIDKTIMYEPFPVKSSNSAPILSSYNRQSSTNIVQLPPVEEFIFKPHTPSPSKAKPSFSIMKKSTSLSPSKKSVIFEQSPPKVLTYSQNQYDSTDNSVDSFDNFTNESNSDGDYSENKAIQFNTMRDFSDNDEDEDESTPPPLPPHQDDNIDITDSEIHKLDESFSKETINKIKNSMSMSEKLDVFLSDDHYAPEHVHSYSGSQKQISSTTNTTNARPNHYEEILLHNVKLKLRQQKEQLPDESEILSNLQYQYQSEISAKKSQIKTESPVDNETTTARSTNLGRSSSSVKLQRSSTLNSIVSNTATQFTGLEEGGSDVDVYEDSFDGSYNTTERSIMTLLNGSATNVQGTSVHLVTLPRNVSSSTNQTANACRSVSGDSSTMGVISDNRPSSVKGNTQPSDVQVKTSKKEVLDNGNNDSKTTFDVSTPETIGRDMFFEDDFKSGDLKSASLNSKQDEIIESNVVHIAGIGTDLKKLAHEKQNFEKDLVADKQDEKENAGGRESELNFRLNSSDLDLSVNSSKSYVSSDHSTSFDNKLKSEIIENETANFFASPSDDHKSINSFQSSPKIEPSTIPASLVRTNSSIKEKAELIQKSLQDSYDFETFKQESPKLKSFGRIKGKVDKVVDVFNQIRISSAESNTSLSRTYSRESSDGSRATSIRGSRSNSRNGSRSNSNASTISVPVQSIISNFESNNVSFVKEEITEATAISNKTTQSPKIEVKQEYSQNDEFVFKREDDDSYSSVIHHAPIPEFINIKKESFEDTQVPDDVAFEDASSQFSNDAVALEKEGSYSKDLDLPPTESNIVHSHLKVEPDHNKENVSSIMKKHELVKGEVFQDQAEILANSTSNSTSDSNQGEIDDKKEDSSAFANSTSSFDSNNVTSRMNFDLPKINTNTYLSFEDLSQQFEDSSDSILSEPTDFLSIWHQKPIIFKDKRQPPVTPRTIPKSFQFKNSAPKSVNVLQRRIVSTNSEDSYGSNALPNVSSDSDFGTSFQQWVVQDKDETKLNNSQRGKVGELSRQISKHSSRTPSSANPKLEAHKQRIDSNGSTRSGITTPSGNSTLQSKNTVLTPSLEIRRTSTKLSPGVILEDEINQVESSQPTIKSSGMKTLPSMDSEDVKRILNTKRVMSQDEYAEFKLLKNKSKGIHIDQDDNRYDEMEQEASIIDFTDDAIILPHLADELAATPTELMKKDRVFDDESEIELMDIDVEFDKMRQRQEKGYSVTENKEIVIAEPDLTEANVNESNDSFDEYHNKYIKENNAQAYPHSPKHSTKVKSEPQSAPLSHMDLNTLQQQSDVTRRHKSFKGHEIKSKKLRKDETTDTSTDPKDETGGETKDAVKSQPASKSKVKLPVHEKGRLFVRIIGLKNLDLPDIEEHQAEFNLVLDNGIHCIKTNNFKLGQQIPIGQEFELTVGESLEFILTLKANYKKPAAKMVQVTERQVVKSKNRFSRLFGAKEVVTKTKFVSQEVKDTWANKFAQDGSFARCYIDFDQYQGKVTGKATNFDITCFNEWELIENPKTGQITKRQPHRIGQLEVKMLFIPRTSSSEILPSSIKSAIESINELNHELKFKYEGFLYQEGGDCESWKRRFFKLEGSSLIAHSETSKKTRAKINLAKVVDVIYMEKENGKSDRSYRNYTDVMLIEHSFKLKFGNGEIIDFGAETREEKITWINLLETILHRNRFRRQPWVKLLLSENQN